MTMTEKFCKKAKMFHTMFLWYQVTPSVLEDKGSGEGLLFSEFLLSNCLAIQPHSGWQNACKQSQ